MFTGLTKVRAGSELVMTAEQAREVLSDWAKESPDGSKIAVKYCPSNPKRGKSAVRFGAYMSAANIKAAIEKGATKGDLVWDLSHGFFVRVYPDK